MRAFFAVSLNQVVREEVECWQRLLKPLVDARATHWTHREDLHVTLKFLGQVPVVTLQTAYSELAGEIQKVGPFSLSFAGVDLFKHHSDKVILWSTVREGVAALTRLNAILETVLEPLGFPREGRSYTPHLTLGRTKGVLDLTQTTAWQSSVMEVTEILLMESGGGDGGPRYRPIWRLPLR